MAFLHGVEFVIVENGVTPITEVKSSIIGLVGIAPTGPQNVLTVISNERQAVEIFGNQVPGFTIPQALAAIYAQGSARVVVVNIFDNPDHILNVPAESLTLVNGKVKLANAPVGAITLTDDPNTTTYVEGTHYEIDAFGNIQILDFTAIGATDSLLATYDKLDLTAIASADVIGSAASPRTGFKLFAESFNKLGYIPKILICPDFCETAAIATEMIAQAEALEAITLIDAPEGTTPTVAITGRGPTGTLAGFQTSSKRVLLMVPHVTAYDPATDASQNRPLSPYHAGVMSQNDRDNGYWASASNKPIQGITGVELDLTAGLSDANSEVNQLNEAGIITVFNSFGTGFRTWGNRSAAFPAITTPDNFYSVERTRDILHESVKLAMLQFIDRPITKALIDSVKASVNSFIRSLIQRGALIDGECTFNEANNPAVDIAAGCLTFEIVFAPPTPAEKIRFNSFIDVNLLAALV